MKDRNKHIDDYILGLLAENDKKTIEKKILKDSDFSLEVADRESEIIGYYARGILEKKQEEQIIKRIKVDKLFEGKILLEQNLFRAAENLKPFYEFEKEIKDIRHKIETEGDAGHRDYSMKIQNPSIYINDKGELVYDGVDDKLKSVVIDLNSIEINEDLLELVEEFEEEEALVFKSMSEVPDCEILYPQNHAVLGTTMVDFILECDNPEDLKGFSIEIYNNDEDCVSDDIIVDGERVTVDLSSFSVGHYFVKLISPKNELIDTKVFHIVYT